MTKEEADADDTTVVKRMSVRGPGSPSSSGSASPRDKEALRGLVHDFVAEASEGKACGLLDMKHGVIEEVEYLVDKQLKVFSVQRVEPGCLQCGRCQRSPPTFGHSFEISRITDLLLEEDLPPCLQKPLQQVSNQETRRRLVLIRYSSDGSGRPYGIAALILDEGEACGDFLTCMNILRLFADNSQSSFGDSPTQAKGHS